MALLNVLINLAAVLTVSSIVGALIMRAAVSLYNNTATKLNWSSIPKLPLWKAFGVFFITMLVSCGVWFAAILHVYQAGQTGKPLGVGHLTVLISALVAGFPVMAGILAASLPTTFGRASLVTFLHLLIALLTAVIVAGCVLVGRTWS